MKNKNLYLLPTDKQIKNVGDLVKDHYGDIHIFTKNDGKEYGKTTTKLNICITSDEEIKEGDWYITILNNEIFKADSDTIRFMNDANKSSDTTYKNTHFKIILTTDDQLIKDGVQSIDDEFLEWFVKNPSCEEVELKKGFEDGSSYGYNFLDYKIIISKEDPKQETQSYICPKTNQNCDDEMCDSASNCNIDNSLIKESKNFSFEEISSLYHQIAKDYKDEFNYDDKTKIAKTHSDNQERMPKQDTLEEFIKKQLALGKYQDQESAIKHSIELGAKWQKERMYSEDDMKKAFYAGEENVNNCYTYMPFEEWFETFKNK